MSVILITIRNNTGYLAKREHDRLTNAVWNISPTDIENDTISLMEARTSDTDSKSHATIQYRVEATRPAHFTLEVGWNNPGANTVKCPISSSSYEVIIDDDSLSEVAIKVNKVE